MAKFSLQKFDIFNMIKDSFLTEKWGTLERAMRHICKNLLNLDCQDRSLLNHVPYVSCGLAWSSCLRAIYLFIYLFIYTLFKVDLGITLQQKQINVNYQN